MSLTIKAENISKEYVLHHQSQAKYNSLRESISNRFSSTFSKAKAETSEPFWALKDVNFEINQGDRVGIIGRNGAGKSTLLKILSRITEPTTGKISINGRVASLLEVGTGFHPELSGRENIFLNGSILGMSRVEIKAKFDEIVAFAEIEKFLDTPVKRYSSGMYVRLAFAVAAHLEPEILIVDEVLAVGDAQFQKKCLGKMQDVAKGGRTILFVSHNLGAIAALCDKGILLQNGKVIHQGDVQQSMSKYMEIGVSDNINLSQRIDRKGNGKFRFKNVRFIDKNGNYADEVLSGESLKIEISYDTESNFDLSKLIVSVSLTDDFQTIVASFISDEMGIDFSNIKHDNKLILDIPELMLRGGNYFVRLFASEIDTSQDNICDLVENTAVLQVSGSDFWKSGKTIRNGQYILMKGNYC